MSSASSNSNDQVICKTLIDYEEYLKLKKLEGKQQDFYKAKTEELKKKIEPINPPNIESSTEQTQQSGSGLTDFALSTLKSTIRSLYEEYQKELISILSKIIEEKINEFLESYGKKLTNVKKKTQTGRGDLVVIPPLMTEEDNTNTKLLNIEKTTTNTFQKSQQQHEGDEEKILTNIPSNFTSKAKKLLHFIYANPLSLSWDTDGVVTLHGTNIPGSNIYEIFPALYKKQDPTDLAGFFSVVTFLLSSGLGHLIESGKVKGLIRKRKLNIPSFDHKEKYWYKLVKSE